MQYRYKMFDGYFPTMQWIIRKNAAVNHLIADDVYVIFCYSDNCNAPRHIITVELTAWKEAIDDTNREHNNYLPPIVNTLKPMI